MYDEYTMDWRPNAGNVTLCARVRSKTWKRILMALVAVPALLIGLLAMHVLAGAGDLFGQHSTMTTTNVMTPAAGSIASVISTEACDQFCGPNHDMGAMACIIALLLSALAALALAASGGWQTVQAALTALASVAARPGGLPPPRPPSLELLSISRI
jgi:hypothetical protein